MFKNLLKFRNLAFLGSAVVLLSTAPVFAMQEENSNDQQHTPSVRHASSMQPAYLHISVDNKTYTGATQQHYITGDEVDYGVVFEGGAWPYALEYQGILDKAPTGEGIIKLNLNTIESMDKEVLETAVDKGTAEMKGYRLIFHYYGGKKAIFKDEGRHVEIGVCSDVVNIPAPTIQDITTITSDYLLKYLPTTWHISK